MRAKERDRLNPGDLFVLEESRKRTMRSNTKVFPTLPAVPVLTFYANLKFAPVAQRIEHLPCRSLDGECWELIEWTTPYAGTP